MRRQRSSEGALRSAYKHSVDFFNLLKRLGDAYGTKGEEDRIQKFKEIQKLQLSELLPPDQTHHLTGCYQECYDTLITPVKEYLDKKAQYEKCKVNLRAYNARNPKKEKVPKEEKRVMEQSEKEIGAQIATIKNNFRNSTSKIPKLTEKAIEIEFKQWLQALGEVSKQSDNRAELVDALRDKLLILRAQQLKNSGKRQSCLKDILTKFAKGTTSACAIAQDLLVLADCATLIVNTPRASDESKKTAKNFLEALHSQDISNGEERVAAKQLVDCLFSQVEESKDARGKARYLPHPERENGGTPTVIPESLSASEIVIREKPIETPGVTAVITSAVTPITWQEIHNALATYHKTKGLFRKSAGWLFKFSWNSAGRTASIAAVEGFVASHHPKGAATDSVLAKQQCDKLQEIIGSAQKRRENSTSCCHSFWNTLIRRNLSGKGATTLLLNTLGQKVAPKTSV